MSDPKLSQQQIQELVVRHEQYRYQAEALAQQMNMLNVTMRDLETALTTISALKEEPTGKEVLVPIGFGSFINATLINPGKIVIGIGAGVSVEKETDAAKALLEKRKEELTKYREQMNNAFTKLTGELQGIERVLQKQEQTGQPQAPMRAE